ncbi:MAG TPA: extracellular solute-binding protein [Solirubrobacterales bacterium]|nr:extracellular solute-binding protein [Solirubrobacterales bacterium]
MDQPNDGKQSNPDRQKLLEQGGLLDEDGLSRRKLLKLGGMGAGALALPAILAACGGGGSSSAGGGSTSGGGGGGESEENPELTKLLDGIESKQVIIGNYGGDTEEVRKKVFWEPFEARTGVQVISADAGSLAVPMLMGEIPTKWDAVHGSITESYAAQIHGKKKLPTVPKIAYEDLILPAKFQPYMWQSFFLAYVPGMIAGTYSGAQPESWADFFDTKKFPGKRGWPAEYFIGGQFEAALMADGVNPDEMYPLDIERAQAKIASIFDDLVIYTEYAQAQSFLTSKTATMSYGPNGLWKELEDKGVEMATVWGANPVLDANGMNIMPEAPNLDAVQALAAYCAQPKLQAEFAQLTNYGPPSKEAFEELTPEQVEALPNAPQRKNAFHDDPVYNAEHQAEIEKAMQEVFAEA